MNLDSLDGEEELPSPALFFGFVLDLLLFGILTAQIYIYYISFPGDRVLLKIAVIWVYVAGVAQTALALVDIYISALEKIARIFPTDSGVLFIPFPDHLSISITALTATVAIAIQSLYAHRIYLISQKRWLANIIICMSIGQFASGILGAYCYSNEQAFSSVFSSPNATDIEGYYLCEIGFKWRIEIWGPLNIVCDLTIVVCMVTFLVRQRKRTMRRQTHSHITKIIQIVVETGIATTILMIVYTVLFWSWTGVRQWFLAVPWHPLPGLMMSKVYSNSMLVLLNNRATVFNGRNAVDSFEFVEVSARHLEGDIHLRVRRQNSATTMHSP